MNRSTVPVSVLYSTTGPYAALGREAVDGAMAAISDINTDARFGFRLMPRIDDPAGNAERYAALAETAIRQHGCRHVIGTITSWSRKEVLPVVERHGALLWYAFPYEGYEASDSVLYLGACPNQHLLPLFDYALPRFGKRPFIVGSNYIWGWEISRIAREQVEAAGGELAAERFVPLGSTEVDHIIEEIRQKKPDLILSSLVGRSQSAFVEGYSALRRQDAHFQPETCPIVSCNLSESDLVDLPPDARAGHITTGIYFDRLDTAENRAFKARMDGRHGGRRALTSPFTSSYTAVSILAQAIADAATDDPTVIRKVATTRQFQTPLGPLSIDARSQHAALRPHLAISDREGQFVLFQSLDAAVDADPYLVRANAMLHRRMAPSASASPSRSAFRVIK